jgi:MoaA/NifB/PqqE/SkfB family radical SAM enzyme
MHEPLPLLPALTFRAAVLGAESLAQVGPLRRAIAAGWERRLRERSARPEATRRHPPGVEADKLALRLALLRMVEESLVSRRLNAASWEGLVGRLIYDIFVKGGDAAVKARFRAEHDGASPPDFLVISPGKACNLRCTGCYANSGPTREKLDFATLERIVSDARELWGTRFFVLSGGEPFAYHDDGKGVMDLAERHSDCFFLMYTNGTLIDERVAKRLGRLGNLSPGVSFEGLREKTDERRGEGVFDTALAAMERMRREGVLFGLSLTATRNNVDEILSDAMVELMFERMGALYAWVFHYMPIGRPTTVDLTLTAQQRVDLRGRVFQLLRERRLFITDFWNSATLTNGCVAGGRAGGYLYVNWNGAVSPCVFVPYSPVNVKDVFARGGDLDDVWAEPFFASIRGWQKSYGYRQDGQTCGEWGNWLRPCLIRDHHAEFRKILAVHPAEPTDEEARAALVDDGYHRALEDFDEELAALTDPIWRAEYLTPRTR